MSSSSRNVDYFFQEQECMMEISECQFIIGTVIGVLLLIAGIETWDYIKNAPIVPVEGISKHGANSSLYDTYWFDMQSVIDMLPIDNQAITSSFLKFARFTCCKCWQYCS